MIHFIDKVDLTPSIYLSWQTIDISSYVSSYCTGAIFHVRVDTGGTFGLRKYGSTDDNKAVMASPSHFWAAIGVDSNKRLQCYHPGEDIKHDKMHLWLVGYFEQETKFFDNDSDDITSSDETWTEVDISPYLDEGDMVVGAIFHVRNIAPTDYTDYGIRKKGFQSDSIHNLFGHNSQVVISGVDSDNKCEIYRQNSNIKIQLMGYIRSDVAFLSSPFEATPTINETWTDFVIPYAGASGIIVNCQSTFICHTYGIRKNGSTDSYYSNVEHKSYAFCELDESQGVETWSSGLPTYKVEFFVIGYIGNFSSFHILSGWWFGDNSYWVDNYYMQNYWVGVGAGGYSRPIPQVIIY